MTTDEKLASEWLKLIEEKHQKGRTPKPPRHRGALWCYGCDKEGHPCDVVKLARALDDCIERMKRARAILHKDKNSEWLMLKPDEHERTLREVAGGEEP